MPFQPGNRLGNRKGRPKKGDSFSELVRKCYTREMRKEATARIIALAKDPHRDDKTRIMAWLALHKAGWPHEQGPNVQVNFPVVPMFQIPGGAVIDVAPVKPLELPEKTDDTK